MYTYYAAVTKVHDGDTIQVDVDLGFHVWHRHVWARIAGISARELTMPGGPEAATYLGTLLTPGIEVVVESPLCGAQNRSATAATRHYCTHRPMPPGGTRSPPRNTPSSKWPPRQNRSPSPRTRVRRRSNGCDSDTCTRETRSRLGTPG
jgi:hypothetical protein